MGKASEVFLNILDEMEFLTKTLATLQIYYLNLNQNLAKIIKETKFFLLNATLDFAIDLDNKMNHYVDKDLLTNRVIKNLENAYENLNSFPNEKKSLGFEAVELEIVMLLNFIKEYSAHRIVVEFDLEEKQLLTNKILIIKSRRTI